MRVRQRLGGRGYSVMLVYGNAGCRVLGVRAVAGRLVLGDGDGDDNCCVQENVREEWPLLSVARAPSAVASSGRKVRPCAPATTNFSRAVAALSLLHGLLLKTCDSSNHPTQLPPPKLAQIEPFLF